MERQAYACTAAVRGIARCRNAVPCPHHTSGALQAPRPDAIFLKVNLNPKWDQRFADAGIARRDRSMGRAGLLSAKHKAAAEVLGRNPYTIREQREGVRPIEPEAVDSGCPVFGKMGLSGVSILPLAEELEKAGYNLSGAHRLARDWKPPIRLVLEFSKDKPRLEHFPWELFRQLISTCFQQVDVWANPINERGEVVHTVNCGKRDDSAKAEKQLMFAGGDWAYK